MTIIIGVRMSHIELFKYMAEHHMEGIVDFISRTEEYEDKDVNAQTVRDLISNPESQELVNNFALDLTHEWSEWVDTEWDIVPTYKVCTSLSDDSDESERYIIGLILEDKELSFETLDYYKNRVTKQFGCATIYTLA